MKGFCGLFFVGLAIAIPNASPALGADEFADADRSTYLAPLPEVALFAAENAIPLEGIRVAGASDAPRPGDLVVLLVTLFEDGEHRQWLVTLTTEELSEADREKKPPKDAVVYTVTGQTLRYPSAWTAVGIRIAGPYGDPSQRRGDTPLHLDRRSRTLGRDAFLSVGFDRWCALVLSAFPKIEGDSRVAPGHIEPGQVLSWAGKPFAADQIRNGKRLAAEVGITPEEERFVAGSMPALNGFLHLAAKTPGSEDIMLQILKVPSLWSIVRQGLDFRIKLQSGSLSLIEAKRWNLPTPVYRMPLTLRINGEDALDCTLAVTEPRPPLRTCAGILGISASSPQKIGTSVAVRVVATRRGIPQ